MASDPEAIWQTFHLTRDCGDYYPRINEWADRIGTHLRILDLGCARGRQMQMLAEAGHIVTGIDISEHAVSLARQRFKDEGLAGTFICGEIMDIPAGPFDAITDRGCMTCMGYSYAKAVVERCRQALVPGGHLRVELISTGSRQYEPSAALGDLLHANAYDVAQVAFYGRRDVEALMEGWYIERLQEQDGYWWVEARL